MDNKETVNLVEVLLQLVCPAPNLFVETGRTTIQKFWQQTVTLQDSSQERSNKQTSAEATVIDNINKCCKTANASFTLLISSPSGAESISGVKHIYSSSY